MVSRSKNSNNVSADVRLDNRKTADATCALRARISTIWMIHESGRYLVSNTQCFAKWHVCAFVCGHTTQCQMHSNTRQRVDRSNVLVVASVIAAAEWRVHPLSRRFLFVSCRTCTRAFSSGQAGWGFLHSLQWLSRKMAVFINLISCSMPKHLLEKQSRHTHWLIWSAEDAKR